MNYYTLIQLYSYHRNTYIFYFTTPTLADKNQKKRASFSWIHCGRPRVLDKIPVKDQMALMSSAMENYVSKERYGTECTVAPFSWSQNVTALQLSCGLINWFRMIPVEQLSSLKGCQCNLLATVTSYHVWIMLYNGFRCSYKLIVIKSLRVIIQGNHLIQTMKTKEQSSDKRMEVITFILLTRKTMCKNCY